MRIRSNLTDGNLYEAPRNGQRSNSQRPKRGPQRRLFRLAVLLVLVLILMREAANPAVYRNFFGALGAPLAGETVPAEILLAQDPLPSRKPNDQETETERTETEDNETRVDSKELLGPGYLNNVSDATIWQPGDSAAFYRLLDIGQLLVSGKGQSGSAGSRLDDWGPPVFVGFVSLLDQPAVYRGERVGVTGTAVRAERIEAAENEFGIEDYWLVWLRPEDGSDRPVMGYAVELPESLKSLPTEGVSAAGPRVLMDGIFLRRHLYQSAKGSELAPVIVGRIRSLVEGPIAGAAVLDSKPEPTMGWQIGVMLLVSGTVGVGFTILIAWLTARNGRWRREVRNRGLKRPELPAE